MKTLIRIGEIFITILIGWSIKIVCYSSLSVEGKVFMAVCLLLIAVLFILFSETIESNY